jgi:DNA-binding NarL/FixJ family response regulator
VTLSNRQSSRRRVLVADNNIDLAQILGEIIRSDESLEFVGYVSSGAEALNKGPTVDVLVLDLSLDDVHGFEVLARLKAKSCPPKVIVHTGLYAPDLAERALRKSAAAFLVKDGDPDALLAAIRNV